MTLRLPPFYCLTLMDFCMDRKPTKDDFINGHFFGTRFGTPEKTVFGTDQVKMPATEMDNESCIERVGRLVPGANFVSTGSGLFRNAEQLFAYYQQEIKGRLHKKAEAEKYPEKGFSGRHLIATKTILA